MQRKKQLVIFLTISLVILLFVVTISVLSRETTAVPEEKTPVESTESTASTEPSFAIIRQPENMLFVPGSCITLSLKAQGTGLQYQWYYRKSGDQMWHIWKNHTKSTTKSTANSSWDGMEVYCTITDNNRTTVASDIITITIEK